MKEIDKIRIKQWNQDNPYIQMKNLENVQPGYRVHTVNDDHHLYELPLETQNIILDWVFWNFYPAQKIYPHLTSDDLKEVLYKRTQIHLHNNQFKEAMLINGFWPRDPSELNWVFHIQATVGLMVKVHQICHALNRMTVLCEPGSKDHILFCFPDSIAV